jgi:hypothetical protein
MSAELVPARSGLSDSLALLPDVVAFAKQIADTSFVPDAYRRKPAEITAAILYGHELGINAMTSLQKISVIKGRPAPAAELGVALALAAGHEVWVKSASTTKVEVCGRRRGSDEIQSVVWTMDDAKRAGLDRQATWRAYPRHMLTHRAQAELVRNAFPDVLGGIAVFAEELEGEDHEPQTVDAEAKTTKRRRRTPAKTTEPEPQPEPPDPAALDPAPSTIHGPDVDLNAPPPRLTAPDATTVAVGPSAAQMKAMHASLSEAGFTERGDRIAFVSAVAQRPVDSSKDLTKTEAGAVIDAAQQLSAGGLGVVIEEDGTWTLVATDLEEDS